MFSPYLPHVHKPIIGLATGVQCTLISMSVEKLLFNISFLAAFQMICLLFQFVACFALDIDKNSQTTKNFR